MSFEDSGADNRDVVKLQNVLAKIKHSIARCALDDESRHAIDEAIAKADAEIKNGTYTTDTLQRAGGTHGLVAAAIVEQLGSTAVIPAQIDTLRTTLRGIFNSVPGGFWDAARRIVQERQRQ